MTTPKATLKRIKVDAISVDPAVQRCEGLDERRVLKMADNFDPLAAGIITISERADGTLINLDGMHRVAAARRSNYAGLIDAKVIVGLDKHDEARLFNLLNATKTPSVFTKLMVAMVAGDPEAVEIGRIVEASGWKLGLDSADGNIAAVTALQRIYRNGNGVLPEGEHSELLERTLDVITRAWEWDRKSADGYILQGVAMLLARFGDVIDDRKLVDQMSDTRPAILLGKAKALRESQGGTVPSALAKMLVWMHNKGRRVNLLPEWVWTR
jgi:hypothetical protein